MVETSLVLMVVLVIVFGLIELGLAVFRYNQVSQVARQCARQASVHGEMAPPMMNQWGPSIFSGTADGPDEIATAVRPYLGGLDPAETTLRLEWPDGDAKPESRVTVTVTTPHRPIVTFLFGSAGWTFTASSTMQIHH